MPLVSDVAVDYGWLDCDAYWTKPSFYSNAFFSKCHQHVTHKVRFLHLINCFSGTHLNFATNNEMTKK